MFPARARTLCLALPILVGCSSDARPPFAGDLETSGDHAEDARADDPRTGEGLIDTSEEENAASCGFVSVEHEIVRPNFYFLLDASESMVESMPNSGGINRHLAARRSILDMLRRVGHRVNFGAALFPDPDAGDGCTEGREVFEIRPGEPLLDGGADNAQLEALAFTLRKYSPTGATPVAATLRALSDPLLALAGPTVLFLLTDGAPNCDVDEPCSVDTCIPNIERVAFDNGVECDDEFNCCSSELLPHLCLDENGTSLELTALKQAGIKSYVIGMPGSEVYSDVLDAMAIAGGTERDATPKYYSVTDAEELVLTLTDLGQQLSASCDFDIGVSPKNRELVHVLADGDSLEEDDSDGWKWSSEQTVTLLGAACDAWRSADVVRIRVVESCKVEVR